MLVTIPDATNKYQMLICRNEQKKKLCKFCFYLLSNVSNTNNKLTNTTTTVTEQKLFNSIIKA